MFVPKAPLGRLSAASAKAPREIEVMTNSDANLQMRREIIGVYFVLLPNHNVNRVGWTP